MILNIALLAAGTLLIIIGCFVRRLTGKSKSYPVLVIGIGTAFFCCGLWLSYGGYVRDRQQKEYIYLSMRCLENQNSEGAVYYLNKTGSSDTCVAAAARSLLEVSRGNNMIARINRDIALNRATSRVFGQDAEENFILQLDDFIKSDERDTERLSGLIQTLIRLLGIQDARKTILDGYADAQSGGSLSEEILSQMGMSETDRKRLQISGALQAGNYAEAVYDASMLVEHDSSKENRLLLAEAVAESAYSGKDVLPDDVFCYTTERGKIRTDASARRERSRLDREYEKIQKSLQDLEESERTKTSDNSDQKLALVERSAELKRKSDNLFAYRAFNAIENIHTIEAGIMRARLHFALRDSDKAVSTLLDIKRDLIAMLLDSQSIRDQLRIVEQAYEGQALFYDSPEFQDALIQLLTSPYPDLLYLSRTPLTVDFMRYIISEQKIYGEELFLRRLDISEYPVVTLTLSGREDILQQIADGQDGVTIHDSGRQVSYTARTVEDAAASICVVIDRSGSMGDASEPGYSSLPSTRIENLKSALVEFVHNMSENTLVSLVTFSDTAEEIVSLTSDQGKLLSKVAELFPTGGTDVNAGIREGVNSLRNATGMPVMLLMTDGEFYLDSTAVEEAAEANVTIHTIGFGSANQENLENISERTGGQHIQADSSSELRNIYTSLQSIIENVVEITYVVDTDGDVKGKQSGEENYVFIKTEGTPGIRAEYTPSGAREQVRIAVCSPALLNLKQPETTRLSFAGEHLDDIESVIVDGQPADIISKTENTLDVTAFLYPVSGWLDVDIQLADGSRQTCRHLLAVGEISVWPDMQFGCMTVFSPRGVILPDGTFLVGGEHISITESAPGSVPLLLSVWGFLQIPDVAGNEGVINGWGEVTLETADGIYGTDQTPAVLTGDWELQYTETELKLKEIASFFEEADE